MSWRYYLLLPVIVFINFIYCWLHLIIMGYGCWIRILLEPEELILTNFKIWMYSTVFHRQMDRSISFNDFTLKKNQGL